MINTANKQLSIIQKQPVVPDLLEFCIFQKLFKKNSIEIQMPVQSYQKNTKPKML